jgi:hypothetical protein
MLKNRFGEFHLRAHNEFFKYFVEQRLENEEIPIVSLPSFLWRDSPNRAFTSSFEVS